MKADARTLLGRRFIDLYEQIVADLGGQDAISEGQRQLARRAAMLSADAIDHPLLKNRRPSWQSDAPTNSQAKSGAFKSLGSLGSDSVNRLLAEAGSRIKIGGFGGYPASSQGSGRPMAHDARALLRPHPEKGNRNERHHNSGSLTKVVFPPADVESLLLTSETAAGVSQFLIPNWRSSPCTFSAVLDRLRAAWSTMRSVAKQSASSRAASFRSR